MTERPCDFLVSEAAGRASRRRVVLQSGTRRLLAGLLVSNAAAGGVRPYAGKGPVVGILMHDANGGDTVEIVAAQASVIGAKLRGVDKPALRDLVALGVQVW